ncbi:hypothetical protein Ancab_024940 [Ancistrocladus abbreviatus]
MDQDNDTHRQTGTSSFVIAKPTCSRTTDGTALFGVHENMSSCIPGGMHLKKYIKDSGRENRVLAQMPIGKLDGNKMRRIEKPQHTTETNCFCY